MEVNPEIKVRLPFRKNFVKVTNDTLLFVGLRYSAIWKTAISRGMFFPDTVRNIPVFGVIKDQWKILKLHYVKITIWIDCANLFYFIYLFCHFQSEKISWCDVVRVPNYVQSSNSDGSWEPRPKLPVHWQIRGGGVPLARSPQQEPILLFSHMFSPKSGCVGGVPCECPLWESVRDSFS